MSKTAEEIIDKNFRGNYWLERLMIISEDSKRLLIEAMEEYASQSYTRTEVADMMKRLLDEAAERAVSKAFVTTDRVKDKLLKSDKICSYKVIVDKQSITSINVEKYLTK